MLTPLLLGWAFAIVMIVLCAEAPQIGRIVFGIFFLIMALVNLVLTVVNPQIYLAFGETTLIPALQEFVLVVFAQDPLFYLIPIVLAQIGMGVMLLSKDPWVHLGLMGAMIFVAAIVPLGNETLANLGLMLALVALTRAPYEHTVLDLIRRRRSRSLAR
jgi:hypothetical protein